MEEKKLVKVDDIRKEADERKCPVQKAAYYIDEFLKGPMCGRCFPCAFGSYEAKLRLQTIINREGTEDDVKALKRIADEMLVASFCKKGKDTANYLIEFLGTGVFEEHLRGICPDEVCPQYVRYKVIGERCINCGECKKVCKHRAILGQTRKNRFQSGFPPFEIRDKRCTRCGDCLPVCPTGAIVLVERKTGKVIKEKEVPQEVA